MLPAWLQTPAAIVLLAGGLLSCFAGYRIFRIVLGIYGFILGALLASSLMGTDQTLWMIVAAIVGGLVGAAMLILAYFVGVALIGAGVGALVANAIWAALGREPGVIVVIVLAIAGALVRAGAAALRDHRRDGVRRGVDGDRRRAGAGGQSRGRTGGGAQRRLAGVSAGSGAGAAVGDRGVARAGAGRRVVQLGITAKDTKGRK